MQLKVKNKMYVVFSAKVLEADRKISLPFNALKVALILPLDCTDAPSLSHAEKELQHPRSGLTVSTVDSTLGILR